MEKTKSVTIETGRNERGAFYVCPHCDAQAYEVNLSAQEGFTCPFCDGQLEDYLDAIYPKS